MKVVCVTGSRSWAAVEYIHEVLRGADVLLVGDCPTGADAIALEYALANDVMAVVFAASKDRAAQIAREHPSVVVHLAADWKAQGKRAGPMRNQALADRAALERDAGMPIAVHAFPLPSSVGTLDAIKRFEAHGMFVSVHRLPAL